MTIRSKLTLMSGVVLSLLSPVGLSANAQEVVRVSGFGSTWAQHAKNVWIDPFEKETGIKVIYDTWNLAIGNVRTMVEAKNITTDVFVGNTQDAILGCTEGILEPIDHSIFGSPNDYVPGTMVPCGMSSHVIAVLMVWDQDKVGEGPKTVADTLDFQKFPGKRVLIGRSRGLPELVLKAQGVPNSEVYKTLAQPGAFDRVLDFLTPNKRDIILWTQSSALAGQLLADGEVAYSQMPTDRFLDGLKAGKKLKVLWESAYYSFDTWFMPKGAKNKENALKFLKFIMARQADMTNLALLAPTRKDAVQYVNPALAPNLPMGKNLDGAIAINSEFWVDHADTYLVRLEAWKQK